MKNENSDNAKLIFVYDNGCPHCTRATDFFNKLDWFDKIESVQLRNGLEINELPGLDIEKAQKEMAVFYKHNWTYGFENFVLIFQKLPLLWVFVPFLYLLKWTKTGDYIYRKSALKRYILPEYCETLKL